MYNITVAGLTSEPIVFIGALGGLYDKDKELFQVKDKDGDIFYFPRENVAYFGLEKQRKADIVTLHKEEMADDLGQ